MNQQPTNQDILTAINTFATDTEHRFQNLESDVKTLKSDMTIVKSELGSVQSDISSMKSELGSVQSDIGSMKSELGSVQSDIGSMKSQMVTKDYLDEKLSDLRGDLVVLVRKEDRKLNALVGVLKEKSVITAGEAQQVLMLEPFVQ